MYGLVNKAIEELVCARFGEPVWEAIKRKAALDIEVFVSMDAYPDDVTYKLVEAASEVLGLSVEELLEAFGEYWVLYTGREGYGEILKMAGDSLPSFLQNLDSLHAHVGVVFLHLKPPTFRCTDIREDSLLLHYYSDRVGLAPMVVGLLKGLGTMFKTETNVTQVSSRDNGQDHDVFLVKFEARAA
ncbi:MAG: heme NO-binding domain-containing protein [Anaerolineae bacterium]